jgi:ankyrin repeat protein
MVAAKKGHSHCIELLWQCSDAQAFDQNFLTAVHHAVIEGHQGVVKKLIALIKKDLADGASIGAYLDDADLLHYALYNNCFDCASYFVSEGADGTRMDKVGNLPLHIVAYKPHCPEVLLDFIIAQSREKDLLSVSNAESKTPLDIALVSGSPKIQTALQQAGGIASLVLHKKAKEKNGNK